MMVKVALTIFVIQTAVTQYNKMVLNCFANTNTKSSKKELKKICQHQDLSTALKHFNQNGCNVVLTLIYVGNTVDHSHSL